MMENQWLTRFTAEMMAEWWSECMESGDVGDGGMVVSWLRDAGIYGCWLITCGAKSPMLIQ